MNMYSRRFFIILFSLTLHFSYLAFALFPEAANEEDFVSFGSNSTFRWAVMKDGTAVITDVITYNNEREEEYRPTTIQIPAKLEGHDVSHIGYFFSFGEYYSPVPGSVRTITVESGSKYFTSQGGVLFSKDMTTLYRYPESNSAISYIIPSSVKYIYHDAFNDCEILTSVTIPSGVTEIGYEAFEDCESLKSLTLPDSMEKIWKNAFKDCISLTNFTIPPNVSSIGRNIFGECEGLTSITVAAGNKYYKSQNGVLFDFNMKTLIAFPANKNVSKYIVPDGVEEIAYAAFEDANILQTVVLPGTLKRIGAYAFCVSKISSINIPQNLIYIGEDAFMGCYDLDRSGVTFDGEIPECAYDAFEFDIIDYTNRDYFNCNYYENQSTHGIMITSYKGPDANVLIPRRFSYYEPTMAIGESAFASCDWISSVSLPPAVVEIGNQAFYDCSSLISITLSSDLLSIGSEAFARCTSLSSVNIPSKVTSIGNNAFDECTSLVSITVQPDNTAYSSKSGILFSKDGKTLLRCPEAYPEETYDVPQGVTTIAANAFKDCYHLVSITFPDSLKDIGENAFSGCTALTKVRLPKDIQKISEGIFQSCTQLAEIDLPASCTSVASNAFSDCNTLTAITLRCDPTQISFNGGLPTTVTTLKVSTEYLAVWQQAYPRLTVTIRSYSDDCMVIIDGSKRVLTNEVSYYMATVNDKNTGAILNTTQINWSLKSPVTDCSITTNGKLSIGNLAHSTQITIQAACLLPDGSNVTGNMTILAQAADIQSGSLTIQPGWNLIAPTFELDDESIARLLALHPFTYDSKRKIYYRPNDFPPGRPIWVFGNEQKNIILTGEK